MMTENVEKNGAWARFMHWYESYQGKKVTGIIYSAGASVVIIGALFKIMHFPGAGAVLMVGMITEALLFMIGCLDKPSGGIVEIGGKNTATMNEKELAFLRNRTVGFVFQQYFLLPSNIVYHMKTFHHT